MTVRFDHPALRVPLNDVEQVELIAALAAHRAERPDRYPRAYTGRESAGADPYVARKKKRGGR